MASAVVQSESESYTKQEKHTHTISADRWMSVHTHSIIVEISVRNTRVLCVCKSNNICTPRVYSRLGEW